MISLLIPTRGRPSILLRSLESIIHSASSTENYEILFGVDKDDTNTTTFLNELSILKEKQVNYKVYLFDPLGYKQLHVYFNFLAEQTNGDLLWVFPDDYEILTKNWDLELLQNKDDLYIYVPFGNEAWTFSLAPIISKKWFNLTGRITNNAQTDLWVGHIADDLKIIKRVSIQTRFFLNADGSQHDSHNFYTRDKEEWEKDKQKITNYIKEKNEKISTNI
jgi:hypothetical protein